MFGFGNCSPAQGLLGKFAGMHGPMGGHHGGPFGGHGCGSPLSGIDLTDDQLEKLAELKGLAFSKFGHGKVDIMDLYKRLFKELAQPTINEKQVWNITDEIRGKKSELTDVLVEHLIAFAKILTPEQRGKLKLNKIRAMMGVTEAFGFER